MATATENSDHLPCPQSHSSDPAQSLPQYSEMIMAAIEALNDEAGSNKSAISKQIEETYGNLPAAHSTLLSHHLNRMTQTNELRLVKNNYLKPDLNAPARRGRGRPPKPKEPVPPGTVFSPPRPRGRPPKPRDPFAPPTEQKKKPPSTPGSGRPRGRPPKKQKTTDEAPAPAPAPAAVDGSAPRGRGRPPKVKPTLAPVAC